MSQKTLTTDDVLHLGRLAQLPLSDREVLKYKKQLDETLEYVKNLDEVVSQKNEHIPDQSDKERSTVCFEDQIEHERVLSPEKALANAHKKKDQYFVVGRI